MAKKREFSMKMESFGDMYMKIFDVLTQKEIFEWQMIKITGLSVKNEVLSVTAPHWIGDQKKCAWRRPWYVSAPGVNTFDDIHLKYFRKSNKL